MNPNFGVIYYNYGLSRAARLVVSLSSLRKYYGGPITILSEGIQSNQLCRSIAKAFDINLKEWNCGIAGGRNQPLLAKTRYHKGTPYVTTIALDSDMLIVGSIEELFNIAQQSEFCVARFSDWKSTDGVVAKRIRQWESIRPLDIEPALNFGPAINCGVVAFQTGALLYKDWSDIALLGRETFIPDEVSCQLMLPRYPHRILDRKWNCSCKYDNPLKGDVRIIHYHGSKHCRVGLPYHGKLWVRELKEVLKKNLAGIKRWMPAEDKTLQDFLNTDAGLGGGRRYSPGVGARKVVNDVVEDRASIVMLNWKRPDNVRKLANYYSSIDLIGEIFIVDNNPESEFSIQCDKVSVIQSPKDLGLFSRFAIGALASDSAVFLLDDDLYLPENTLRELFSKWKTQPNVLHGIFGRNSTPEGYSRKAVHGNCEIVLTRAVLTTPEVCGHAVSYSHQFHRELLGEPKGNGEDILLSYIALSRSGESNRAHKLPYKNLSDVDSIHRRVSNHYAHRSAVVKWCRKHICPTSIDFSSSANVKIDVSYCSTCHNRLWQLALTLTGNLDRLLPDEELVLVDYGSPDGLWNYIRASQHCMQAIRDKKLVYVRVEANHYHCPKAKNLAHRIAQGRILVNLDADNSNEGMREVIERRFSADEKIVLHMDNNMHNGAFGRIGLTKEWFYRLGGYDESFLPSAYQDSDLIERAKHVGLKYVLDRANDARPIKNTMIQKAINTGSGDWWNMKRLNKEASDRNLREGRFIANTNGWGEGVLKINFGSEMLLEPLFPGRGVAL